MQIDPILVLLFLVLLSPFIVYVAVKLGTVAWFQGRQVFIESQKENKDGEKK